MKRILIIEDDADIRDGVRVLLEGQHFHVDEASSGLDGLNKLTNETCLVILDIMMPGMSGLTVCKRIREFSFIPILFLTAKDSESDKLIGFMAGADDYLVKPFSHTELFARVTALLRRSQVYNRSITGSAQSEDWITLQQLKISSKQNLAFRNNQKLSLTETEYQLLLFFMQHPHEVFSLQTLYQSIWKEPFLTSSANTVMVHIRNLRGKIEENPRKPTRLHTVWGKGYRID